MAPFSIFLFCLITFSLHTSFTTMAVDTLFMNQTLRDGQTIVSSKQSFELGFFTLNKSTSQNRYLGIRYKRLATGSVAWIANRETPIKNKTGELTLHPGGLLVLRDSATDTILWSTNTKGSARNPVARLLDSGNLMIIDNNNHDNEPEDYIWQSFDYPGDTILPGMKFGWNFKTGTMNMTSWKSDGDPSKGPFVAYINLNGLPQFYLNASSNSIQHRLGSWNGRAFIDRPGVILSSIYRIEYVSNEKEIYTRYDNTNDSILSRMTVTPAGIIGRYTWVNRTQGWFLFAVFNTDACERYSVCGAYGICDSTKSINCGCLEGFEPKSRAEWDVSDWTNGCQREVALDCGIREGFRKYEFMKLPDAGRSWFDTNMTIEQCKTKCKNECNCTAYATLNIVTDIGCLLWYDELIDMKTIPRDGQDIYIRLAASELGNVQIFPYGCDQIKKH